jgi:hypothetical protein
MRAFGEFSIQMHRGNSKRYVSLSGLSLGDVQFLFDVGPLELISQNVNRLNRPI